MFPEFERATDDVPADIAKITMKTFFILAARACQCLASNAPSRKQLRTSGANL
jgi:hypothetical protein